MSFRDSKNLYQKNVIKRDAKKEASKKIAKAIVALLTQGSVDLLASKDNGEVSGIKRKTARVADGSWSPDTLTRVLCLTMKS